GSAPRRSRDPRASGRAPPAPDRRRSRPWHRAPVAQPAPVHVRVVLPVGAALDRLPPRPVLAVPRDRGREALLEAAPRLPARLPQPGRVERVAAVVARAV